jgi:hypothetical protein
MTWRAKAGESEEQEKRELLAQSVNFLHQCQQGRDLELKNELVQCQYPKHQQIKIADPQRHQRWHYLHIFFELLLFAVNFIYSPYCEAIIMYLAFIFSGHYFPPPALSKYSECWKLGPEISVRRMLMHLNLGTLLLRTLDFRFSQRYPRKKSPIFWVVTPLNAGFLVGLVSDPEDGGDTCLRNVNEFLVSYMALQPTRSRLHYYYHHTGSVSQFN